MVVRVKSTKLPKGLFFAAAGGVLILMTGVFAIRHHVIRPETSQCAERAASAERLPIRDNGATPFTVADLQASFSEQEWGLTEHGAIIARDGDRKTLALKIALAAGAEEGGTAQRPGSGAGFVWVPGLLRDAETACLTYALRLDAPFPPGGVIKLPGLTIAADRKATPDETADAEQPDDGTEPEPRDKAAEPQEPVEPEHREITLRIGRDRAVRVAVAGTELTRVRWFGALRKGETYPTNRWVQVSQEVVLNSPGQADGAIRVWLDGRLVLEHKGLALRRQQESRIKNVLARVHFVDSDDKWVAAPKATAVALTPFIVRR